LCGRGWATARARCVASVAGCRTESLCSFSTLPGMTQPKSELADGLSHSLALDSTGHEDAEWIGNVSAERSAPLESRTFVKIDRRKKRFTRPRFKPHASEAHGASLRNDMFKDRATDASTEKAIGHAHGFDLALLLG